MAAKPTQAKKKPGEKAPTRRSPPPDDTSEQEKVPRKRIQDPFDEWDSVDSNYFRKG